MKHLLILLFLLPMFVIGQERQQKMNLRNYGSVAPKINTQPAPSYQQPRIQPGRENSYLESQQKQHHLKDKLVFHGSFSQALKCLLFLLSPNEYQQNRLKQ